MGYQYVSAIAKQKAGARRWSQVDLSTIPLTTIYQNYVRAIVTLSNSFLGHNVALDLEDYRATLSLSSKTLPQWLAGLGNTALNTSDTLPEIKVRNTRYRDAWRAGYSVKLVPHSAHQDAELTNAAKDDLLLTREHTPYDTFHNHCLITVNGLFHQTRYSEDGIYVTDGGESGRIANKNTVGIVSFLDIAPIECVNITTGMVYRPQRDMPFKNGVYLNVGKSFENKSVLLVLGGYLQYVGQHLEVVGDGLLRIDFNNLPFTQRFFESRKLMDLTSLPLSKTDSNPSQVALDELYSDASILAYLNLTQSFVVIVDTPELFVDRHQVEFTGFPGKYISHVEPRSHLELALGRVGDYWVRTEDGKWLLSVETNETSRYQYETTGWQGDHSIDPSRRTIRPFDYTDAFYVEIGTELKQ